MVKTSALIGVGGCDDKVFVQDNSLPLRIAGNHLRSIVAKKFLIGESKKQSALVLRKLKIESWIIMDKLCMIYLLQH